MDLNTVTEVVRPRLRSQLPEWRPGDALLAGGTWLFSEPQLDLARLIDLQALGWPALTIDDAGLSIAATCTVARLNSLHCPVDWTGAVLIDQCCRAFLASFKIWETATVGGNLCMSLPAGPMIAFTAALDGTCIVWEASGAERRISVMDFVTGNRRNVLGPGDILRQIDVPAAALRRRCAFRQISLTPVGRSAALLIGTVATDGGFTLTVTGSTIRPIKFEFPAVPDEAELHNAIRAGIDRYHDDVHGTPHWRKHMTLRLAEEIRAELRPVVRP